MRDKKVREIATTALMSALVFVATFLIKIPNPATGGYSHMGDCMIFLAVVLLGRKNGSIAAGIGGALSDFLAGAPVWILPTLIIKYVMAFIMGTIVKANPESKKLQIVGAAVGGLFQIAAYTLAKILLIGLMPALLSIPNVSIQTLVGIVLFAVLSAASAGPLQKIRNREGK
ncbi:MAG: ECF transporter S component [Clostridia bacterium]|nr:ECF transporter S component [Clostridia bacterium]